MIWIYSKIRIYKKVTGTKQGLHKYFYSAFIIFSLKSSRIISLCCCWNNRLFIYSRPDESMPLVRMMAFDFCDSFTNTLVLQQDFHLIVSSWKRVLRFLTREQVVPYSKSDMSTSHNVKKNCYNKSTPVNVCQILYQFFYRNYTLFSITPLKVKASIFCQYCNHVFNILIRLYILHSIATGERPLVMVQTFSRNFWKEIWQKNDIQI